MADMLSLDLVDKGLVTDQIVLTINYDRESLKDGHYKGELMQDRYGRTVPKYAHGTQNLDKYTSSTRKLTEAAMMLFDRITDRTLLTRRLTLVVCNVIREDEIPEPVRLGQLNLFDEEKTVKTDPEEDKALEKERAVQEAMLSIKHKFGKNAVLKAANFTEGATAKDRNRQIGGHKA